jgi:hypothetical protein
LNGLVTTSSTVLTLRQDIGHTPATRMLHAAEMCWHLQAGVKLCWRLQDA